jgi:S1-C subfamily serine protease
LSVLPFPVQLKKSVVNIELQCTDGNQSVSGAGTGFVVGYIDSRLPKGTFFAYLVTNRHVAECWDEKNHSRPVQTLMIRVNTKDGSSKRIPANPTAWRFSHDDSVDLAVMPVLLPNDLDLTYLSLDMFATSEFISSHQIAEGSSIILSGYFYQFPGQRRFESIVREGILSMVPEEPMITTTGKPGTVYLCDVHIFGGNSGSPVVVAADSLGIDGYRLLGVVSGYYFEDENVNLEIATTVRGLGHANSGIAMVVPVQFLRDLLDMPELKSIRDAYLSTLPAAAHP